MYQAKLIQVIETTLLERGSGKSVDDPCRRVTQYWSLTGELLAERDPYKEQQEIEAILQKVENAN